MLVKLTPCCLYKVVAHFEGASRGDEVINLHLEVQI
jgi:hypothetical protein